MAKASTKTSVKKGLKEIDRISNAGTAKVFRVEKERAIIGEAMSDENLKNKVLEWIFDGDYTTASPLQEIRDSVA